MSAFRNASSGEVGLVKGREQVVQQRIGIPPLPGGGAIESASSQCLISMTDTAAGAYRTRLRPAHEFGIPS
ncbi:hypothetical protein, partial [Thiohalocapsa halophila]